MNKEEFDKLYKRVEGKLFSYNKIKDDIEIINLEIEKVKMNLLNLKKAKDINV